MAVGALQRLAGGLLIVLSLGVALSYAPDRPVDTLVARWAPPPSDFIDLGGQLVHLRDEGPRDDALPIVLIHGTGDSLHTWQGWADRLKATRRVIRFDLPGFGLTGPAADGDYRGDRYARFVLQLMDRLGVQRFVVGGNSLGGEVAWRTASLAPQRVHQLILVDASGYTFRPTQVPLAFQLARLPGVNWMATSLTPRAIVDRSVRTVYARPERVTSDLVDRYHELTLRAGNRQALVQRLRQLEDEHGRDIDRLARLTMPTLILWGREDRLIPLDSGERFDREIPNSTLVVLDDLGHVPQQEDPQRSLQPVLDFLAR